MFLSLDPREAEGRCGGEAEAPEELWGLTCGRGEERESSGEIKKTSRAEQP